MLFKMAPVFPEKLPYLRNPESIMTYAQTVEQKKTTQEDKQFTVFNYFTSSTKLITIFTASK